MPTSTLGEVVRFISCRAGWEYKDSNNIERVYIPRIERTLYLNSPDMAIIADEAIAWAETEQCWFEGVTHRRTGVFTAQCLTKVGEPFDATSDTMPCAILTVIAKVATTVPIWGRFQATE